MFASQSGTADEGIHIISRITNFIWNKFSDRKSVDSVCVNQNKLPEMLQVSSELVKDVTGSKDSQSPSMQIYQNDSDSFAVMDDIIASPENQTRFLDENDAQTIGKYANDLDIQNECHLMVEQSKILELRRSSEELKEINLKLKVLRERPS